MLKIVFKINNKNVDSIVEKLQFNDIFNVYYEQGLNITVDDWGYGYEENLENDLDFNIMFTEEDGLFSEFLEKVENIVGVKASSVTEEEYSYEEEIFPEVIINDNWSLIHPNESTNIENRINFISQGAFGTGLHETTKDILSYILNTDFKDNKVMDIGTGSGVLALATAMKGAAKVTAIDIRDVKDEVLLNASFNNLDNIEVKVGDALNNEFEVDDLYDWIYINIGGEETQMFMDYINTHLKSNGKLLVSGLVEWSFDFVKEKVCEKGYKIGKKLQTNEWCTAIFSKI